MGGPLPDDPACRAWVLARPICVVAGCHFIVVGRKMCQRHFSKRMRWNHDHQGDALEDMVIEATDFSILGLCRTPLFGTDPCAWRYVVIAGEMDLLGQMWAAHLQRDHGSATRGFRNFKARDLYEEFEGYRSSVERGKSDAPRAPKKGKRRIPVIGERIGNWTIVAEAGRGNGGVVMVKVRCACGTVKDAVQFSQIARARSQGCRSCGGRRGYVASRT